MEITVMFQSLKSPEHSASNVVSRAAFTLIEIVIALAVLGTMASGCYIGFNSINTYAVSTRLYSEAQTVAQNQVDLVLSKGPFNITSTPYRVPIELMLTSELAALPLPSQPPTTVPLITDPYYPYYPYYRDANGLLAKEGFIYSDPNVIDPSTGKPKVLVTGTMTCSVTDSGAAAMTYAGIASNLNVRKVTTTVSYSFRNRNYNVSLETLRTADQ